MPDGWTNEEVARRNAEVFGTPVASVAAVPKRAKYGNVKTECDGILFDSSKEAQAYQALKIIADRGVLIAKLERQVPFVLQDKAKGRRAIKMVVDFLVTWTDVGRPDPETAQTVFEVKSKPTRTQVYLVKKKMFLARYPKIHLSEWM